MKNLQIPTYPQLTSYGAQESKFNNFQNKPCIQKYYIIVILVNLERNLGSQNFSFFLSFISREENLIVHFALYHFRHVVSEIKGNLRAI